MKQSSGASVRAGADGSLLFESEKLHEKVFVEGSAAEAQAVEDEHDEDEAAERADDEFDRELVGQNDETPDQVAAENEERRIGKRRAQVVARFTGGDIFGTHVTPRAYLVFKPNEVLSFKGGVAGGYKVPSVKELTDGIYEVNGGRPNNDPRFGNSDLEPEESWNYELPGTLAFPSVGSLTVSGFFTDFKNKIDYEDSTWYMDGYDKAIDIERRINIGKVEAKGVEVLFSSAVFNGFSLTGSYTCTKSEIKSDEDNGKPLSSLPEHVISAKLSYENGGFGSFLRVRAKMDMANTGGKC